MDESGVEENLSSEYGYAKKGKRLYAKKKDSRYSRRSLISAIGKNEIKASLEIKGSVNAEVIKKYFKEILLPKLEPESIIVLDNASIHKSKELERIVKEAKCELLFLPTYSPDLNPIENMWSKIKQIIRKLQYKCKDSYERIKAGFNSITSFDCQAYFRHFINIINTPLPVTI